MNALKNSRGVSLVEVLIALSITLVLFLALMQSALLSIEMNTSNVIRDEAVNVAEERMRQLRTLPFDQAELNDTAGSYIDDCPGTDTVTCNGETLPCNTLCRNFKNLEIPFTSEKRIANIPAGTDPSAKQIDVLITWQWQFDNVTGAPIDHQHVITSIKRDQ